MKQEGSIISKPLDPFKGSLLALIKPDGGKKSTTSDEPQPGPSTAGAINNMSEESTRFYKIWFFFKYFSICNLTESPALIFLSDKASLPAFWLPSLTPDDKGHLVKKPDTKVVCPMTKKPLAMKHLITGENGLFLSFASTSVFSDQLRRWVHWKFHTHTPFLFQSSSRKSKMVTTRPTSSISSFDTFVQWREMHWVS